MLKLCMLLTFMVTLPQYSVQENNEKGTVTNKWTFIGYRIREQKEGCNPNFGRAVYSWILEDANYSTNRKAFEEEIKKQFPGQYYEFFCHKEYSGNCVAVVENLVYCSSRKITNSSYSFFSGKDKATVEAAIARNKSYTPDIKGYNVKKIIDYQAETEKFRLQGQSIILGETF